MVGLARGKTTKVGVNREAQQRSQELGADIAREQHRKVRVTGKSGELWAIEHKICAMILVGLAGYGLYKFFGQTIAKALAETPAISVDG